VPKKYVYDYYQVNVPKDLGDRQQRIQAAFMEAENKSKIWAMPSEWEILTPMDEFDEVEDILVRRKRRNMRCGFEGRNLQYL
jgi:hypothetical protein